MNNRSRTLLRCACMALLAAALGGCGEPIRNKVEKRIEAQLPQIIGPAREYHAEVTGSPFSIVKGKLSTLAIEGIDVQLSPEVRISRLLVNATDVEFDRNRSAVTRVGGTTYSAEITEDALNAYLSALYSDVPGLKISLPGSRLRVFAEPRPAGVPVRIAADAALKVRNGHEIVLDLTDIEVYGVSSPGFAREYIETRVNPVFDSRRFGYNAAVSNVRIMKKYLRLEGTIDLASAMAAR